MRIKTLTVIAFLAAAVIPARAVDISGTIDGFSACSIPGSVNNTYISVSTVPLKNPADALNLSVVLATDTVMSAGSIPYAFLGLPGGPDTYYVFAFRESGAGDLVPNGVECMGGAGPFAGNDPNAQRVALSSSDVFGLIDFPISDRAKFYGTLTNNSVQPGQRLIVQATPSPFDSMKLWRVALATGPGGAYSLDGLLPGSYLVEGFVDTQSDGANGSYNPDPFEDKGFTGPYTLVAGGATMADFTISSGVVAGAPSQIRILGPNNSYHQVIATGAPSGFLQVSVRDENDRPVPAGTSVTIQFAAFDSSGPAISYISFDSFSSTTSTAMIAGGQNTFPVPFQFLRDTPGWVTLQAQALNFPAVGQSRFAYFSFNVLPGGSGFSNANVRTTSQPSASTGTAATISPDRDGVDDGAVFTANPPASTIGWELVISTESSFTSGVVRRQFRFGSESVYWYGEGAEGRVVPNGTYFARFQTEGEGLVSSTMTVSVQAAAITGVIHRGVSPFDPISDVSVSLMGPGGGGYARSAMDGTFFVSGLVGMSTYTLQLNKPGFAQANVTAYLNSTGTWSLGSIPIDPGAEFRVSVNVLSAPSQDLFGRVFVHNSSFTSTASGSLHLAPGALATDNGFPAADPAFSTVTVLNVIPNTLYNVEIDLPQYGRVMFGPQLSPTAGFSVDLSTTLARKANLSGKVTFPSALSSPYYSEWVSVDAVRSTEPTRAVAWGGVSVYNGQSTGTYQVFGVDPGNYILRAFARGFVVSTQSVVVGTVDLANLDFPVFNTGGTATGTVTVEGDSSGLPSALGGPCSAGQFPLSISAHSPNSFSGAYAQVCLSASTSTTSTAFVLTGLKDGTYDLYSHLPGFALAGTGPQRVTVSGGVGSKNISLQAQTGRINLTAQIPIIDAGPLVSYELSGPSLDSARWGYLSGSPSATATIAGLGTGLYTLTVVNQNPGRGLIRHIPVAVTNGAATPLTVDMTIPTYGIGGVVTIQGNIVLPSTWNVVASSMSGLSAAGAFPEIEVYAFPLPTYFDGRLKPLRRFPLTPHASSSTFVVTGLPPGGYLLKVGEDLNPSGPPVNCPDCFELGQPELASGNQVVFISTANVPNVPLQLTNGAVLSGTIRRPAGDASTDSRHFTVQLRRSDNLIAWKTETNTSGTGSADYQIGHLASGNYLLELIDNGQPAKYTAAATPLTVGTTDLTQDIDLVAAGSVRALLRDADTDTLLTSENAAQFLPNGFSIAAEPVPWVPGGWVEAERSTSSWGFKFDPVTGEIGIPRLRPDTNYNIVLRGFESLSEEAKGKGQRTYAPTIIAGVRVSGGQILNLGTIDLRQGGSLTGTLRNAAGLPLANIRVRGVPSLSNGSSRHEWSVETFSDANGVYRLMGIDRSQRYYDVVAAPRYRPGETYAQLSGKRYGEVQKRMIDVNDANQTSGIDFVMEEANAVLIGRVTTVDGGQLTPAFTDSQSQQGLRGADLVLHREGTPAGDNPLGEIEERTDADGYFRVEGLTPGAYTIRAIALGYATALKTVSLKGGATISVGAMTLGKGATVSGPITKPDGSLPSQDEVGMVVGVDEAFEDFVFGRVDASEDSQLVTGYEISGFSTGKSYSLLILSKKDDLLEAASGLTFASSTESLVVPLLYQPSPPKVFVNQSRSGNTYTLRFFTNQPVRNLTTDDSDPTKLIVLSSGTGTLDGLDLSASRDTLTAVYTAPINEASFTLRLTFYSELKDPSDSTGGNFLFDKSFTFYSGIGRRRSVDIPNVLGGTCDLEGVASGAEFPAGSFDVASSSTVEVGIQAADTYAALPAGAPRAARGMAVATAARRRGAAAYPSASLFAALSASESVDPFSPFYDIFLPAGIRRALKKEANITLAYDDAITDPSRLNVYYYDPAHELFVLEKSGRTVDSENNTITVSVSHLSTFVVLNSNAPVVHGDAFAGGTLSVHNVPNPFSLESKTVALSDGGAITEMTTEGTAIKIRLPAGKSGDIRIEIFDVAGTRVREINSSAPADQTTYYVEWDGRNDDGKKVASGVYIGRFTLAGNDARFFKMAVIK